MILTRLTLNDFGLYGGEHTLDLRPHPGPDGHRPLILFGGKNGAGKSTLLEAIRLCLYGRDALGFRVRPADYDAYIEKRLHRSRGRTADRAAVALEFEYVDRSETTHFRIERSWSRSADHVEEHLELRRNGEVQFGLGPDHWQDLLKDVIPLGLADLFFFDGERIQSLADDERGSAALGQALKDLLGVSLVEQLEADLGVYLTRLSKSETMAELLQQLEAAERQRAYLDEQLSALRQDIAGYQTQLDRVRAKMHEIESAIASNGGSFAQQFAANQGRKQALLAMVEQCRRAIEDIAGELLPFALAPALGRQLVVQLQTEEQVERREAARDALLAQAKVLASEVLEDAFWQGIPGTIPLELRQAVSTRLQLTLQAQAAIDGQETAVLHGLSARDRARLIHWVEDALGPVAQRSAAYIRSLMDAESELEQVERMLQAVPPEELLAPLIRELHLFHGEETRLQAAQRDAHEQARQAAYAKVEVERTIKKLEAQRDQRVSSQKKGQLASKATQVLAEFRRELLRMKIADLEAAFTDYFNRLVRKHDFVSHVLINEHDFSMTLVSRDGRYIPKAQLSAGEKQIYAIALLWALRAVAARPLPVIIDTPLGRLDSTHRQHLVEHYFPNASHQVILLSTDTEIDETYFRELEPFVSHAYHLVYGEAEQTTRAQEGYFWRGVPVVELSEELSHAP